MNFRFCILWAGKFNEPYKRSSNGIRIANREQERGTVLIVFYKFWVMAAEKLPESAACNTEFEKITEGMEIFTFEPLRVTVALAEAELLNV